MQKKRKDIELLKQPNGSLTYKDKCKAEPPIYEYEEDKEPVLVKWAIIRVYSDNRTVKTEGRGCKGCYVENKPYEACQECQHYIENLIDRLRKQVMDFYFKEAFELPDSSSS